MKNLIIIFCLFFSLVAYSAETTLNITPEVAQLIVLAKFAKARALSKDDNLKKELSKLLDMNKMVADSYQKEIGKKITVQIRGKEETGTLTKIKGTTLYVKIKKGMVTATWPVKVKTLPIDFRMNRIEVSDSLKNLYFGAKAFRQKNYPAAKYYLKKTGAFAPAVLEAADKESKYILSLSGACVSGDLEKTKELVKKGADINGKIIAYIKNPKTGKIERHESTVLIESIKKHQKEIIKYLVKSGADPNKGNAKGVTPLMFAIMYFPQDMEILEYLLNHQADTKAIDKSGNTPLTGAVGAGIEKAVKVLLKHGVDVNSPNKKGYTPIMVAVAANNAKMFKLLMEKGADLHKKHPRGWSIFKLDRTRMDPEIREVLDKMSPPKEKPKSTGFPIMNRGLNVMPGRR